MKKAFFDTALIVGLVFSGTVAFFITKNGRNIQTEADGYEYEFKETLEIHTLKEVYYVDLKTLQVQTEGSDSVFYFNSAEGLAVWLSDQTAQDSGK